MIKGGRRTEFQPLEGAGREAGKWAGLAISSQQQQQRTGDLLLLGEK